MPAWSAWNASWRRASAITVTAARTAPANREIVCVYQMSPRPMASRPAAKPVPSAGHPVAFFVAPWAGQHSLMFYPRQGYCQCPGQGPTRNR